MIEPYRGRRFWMLPIDPIEEYVEARGGLGPIMHKRGLRHGEPVYARVERAYGMAKASGELTITAADSICIDGLGKHPVAIYKDMWWVGLE